MFLIIFKNCNKSISYLDDILNLPLDVSALHIDFGVNTSVNVDKTIIVRIETRIIPPMRVKTTCAINIWPILFMRLFSMFVSLVLVDLEDSYDLKLC